MKKVAFGTIKDGNLSFSDRKEFEQIIKRFEGGYFMIQFDKVKMRTRRQNNALHLFCEQLARALNDSGLDQRKVLKPSYSIDWEMVDVKERLWRPFQIAITGKESTTDLDSQVEITKIHKTLMRELGEKHGVGYIPFPAECRSCGCLSGQGHEGSNHYEGCEEYAK